MAEIPLTHAKEVRGFLPARRGRLELAPLLKRIERNLGITVHGTAVWLSKAGEGDKLLLFAGNRVYTCSLYQVYKYDERLDGQHSYYSLPAPALNSYVFGGSAANGLETAQFSSGELIISIAGLLYRYYVTLDGLGTETIYQVGLGTPGAPTLAATTGGSMTTGQTYEYLVTYQDEFSRDSSPSASASVSLTNPFPPPAYNAVTITQNAGPYLSGGGETYWSIYRRNPGATAFTLVTTLPLGTTSYTDTYADSAIAANATAPTSGENDPPGVLGPAYRGLSNIMTVWKDRLVLNDLNAPNMIQVSNVGSPTQFSSLPLPTNLTDGLRTPIGGKGQNEVTGMASLGSLLAIFGREATDLLYGDDISSFALRNTLDRGCQNPRSVQRCENDIRFLSDDGIYAIGYENGYTVVKVSQDIDDLFLGFHKMAAVEVTDTDRTASIQVSNALFQNVTSFYSENRYYLSFGNRTLVQDIQSAGWTDTGWGFLRTATRYLSQMADLNGSAPETVFITLGDTSASQNVLYYYTVADTPEDRDAPFRVPSRLVLRPINPENADSRIRRKRPVLLSQFGTTKAKKGDLIGFATWYSDGYTMGTMPIHAWVTWRRKGALFELAPPSFTGEEVWVEFEYWPNDLQLEATIIEIAICN